MKRKLICTLLVVALVLASTVTAFAYSGSYSFEIRTQVTGTKKHSLDAKQTTVSGTAKTYCDPETDWLSTGVESYKVTLVRAGLFSGSVTTNAFRADGVKHSHSFAASQMKACDHTVNVFISSSNIGALAVKGSGTIKQ